jgi:hypothetical protein
MQQRLESVLEASHEDNSFHPTTPGSPHRSSVLSPARHGVHTQVASVPFTPALSQPKSAHEAEEEFARSIDSELREMPSHAVGAEAVEATSAAELGVSSRMAPHSNDASYAANALADLPRGARAELATAVLPAILGPDELRSRALSLSEEHVPAALGRLQLHAEINDPFRATDVRFQFLALRYAETQARPDLPELGALVGTAPRGSAALDAAGRPAHVFLAFKLLRFPVVCSPVLTLGNESRQDDSTEAFAAGSVLYQTGQRARQGHVHGANGPAAGWQSRFVLDPAALGETPASLARRLAHGRVQIHVYNASTHLLLGVAELPLRHLLRNGQRATLTPLRMALRVADPASNRPEREAGALYLRVGCLGTRSTPSADIDAEPAAALQGQAVIVNPTGAQRGDARGASQGPLRPQDGGPVTRLAEADANLAAALLRKPASGDDADDARKAVRLAALGAHNHNLGLASGGGRREATGDSVPLTTSLRVAPLSYDSEAARAAALPQSGDNLGLRSSRELHAVEGYRATVKRETITALLQHHLTSVRALSVPYGTTVYLEYILHNPSSEQLPVVVLSNSPDELSVVTNAAEWHELARAHGCSGTVIEEHMFQQQPEGPLLLLAPDERVVVPLKFRLRHDHPVGTFPSALGPLPQSAAEAEAAAPPGHFGPPVPLIRHARRAQAPLQVEVRFEALTGRTLGLAKLVVTPLPPVVDKTFQFYEAERTLFKRRLRIPADATELLDNRDVFVVCSDAEAYCSVTRGEDGVGRAISDIYIKCAGASPESNECIICSLPCSCCI